MDSTPTRKTRSSGTQLLGMDELLELVSKSGVLAEDPQPRTKRPRLSRENRPGPKCSKMKSKVKQPPKKANKDLPVPNSQDVDKSVDGEEKYASYDWKMFLKENPETTGVPASCFAHLPLPDGWKALEQFKDKRLIEVRLSKQEIAVSNGQNQQGNMAYFWIASLERLCGLMAKVRLEGVELLPSKQEQLYHRWNLITTSRHIGFCKTQPTCEIVAPKFWRNAELRRVSLLNFLYSRLIGCETIPQHMWVAMKYKYNWLEVGYSLEVVDKDCFSKMKVGKVVELMAGRVHVRYWDSVAEPDSFDFACHEKSDWIRPIGWSKAIGLELSAPPNPPSKENSQDDSMLTCFPEIDLGLDSNTKIEEGMRLEAVDITRRAWITSAYVKKVLKNGYIMVANDHCEDNLNEDPTFYHISSLMIFPCGFCKKWGIPLRPPMDYTGQPEDFSWPDYLKRTGSKALDIKKLRREVSHGFKVGMKLETMELLDGDMICPTTIKGVFGRLLQISFDGWSDEYDQWMDCESPELYPVGWCEMNRYLLRYPGDAKDYWNTTPAASQKSTQPEREKEKAQEMPLP